jgi:hypothetical protein
MEEDEEGTCVRGGGGGGGVREPHEGTRFEVGTKNKGCSHEWWFEEQIA